MSSLKERFLTLRRPFVRSKIAFFPSKRQSVDPSVKPMLVSFEEDNETRDASMKTEEHSFSCQGRPAAHKGLTDCVQDVSFLGWRVVRRGPLCLAVTTLLHRSWKTRIPPGGQSPTSQRSTRSTNESPLCAVGISVQAGPGILKDKRLTPECLA